MRGLALCLALSLALGLALSQAGRAQADGALEAAQAAQAQLGDARAQLERAEKARDRIAALTATVRAYETGLSALREGLRRVAQREAQVSAALEAKSNEIGRLLGVLQTMERAPTPLLLLHPSGPAGTARSGMMLSEVTPALQAEAEALRAQLQEVAALREVQDGGVATLQKGLDEAQAARAALSEAMSSRTELPGRFIADPVAQALLVAGADTLDSFAQLLGQIDGPEGLPSEVTQGTLPLPVQGTVLRGFNQRDAAGIRRPGLLIASEPRALVTAPMAATVRFAGPLLDYDSVVVLEPATDVLLILAGLGEVLAEVGEVLSPGAPVGLMGGSAAESDPNVSFSTSATGALRSETLYIEVREGGRPVDPAPWFAQIE